MQLPLGIPLILGFGVGREKSSAGKKSSPDSGKKNSPGSDKKNSPGSDKKGRRTKKNMYKDPSLVPTKLVDSYGADEAAKSTGLLKEIVAMNAAKSAGRSQPLDKATLQKQADSNIIASNVSTSEKILAQISTLEAKAIQGPFEVQALAGLKKQYLELNP
jgi:hypothetical protein